MAPQERLRIARGRTFAAEHSCKPGAKHCRIYIALKVRGRQCRCQRSQSKKPIASAAYFAHPCCWRLYLSTIVLWKTATHQAIRPRRPEPIIGRHRVSLFLEPFAPLRRDLGWHGCHRGVLKLCIDPGRNCGWRSVPRGCSAPSTDDVGLM